MALYASIADVEARLPVAQIVQLAGGAAQGSTAYDAAVTTALEHASAMVDSYAGARYSLPLAGSERLEQLTVDLAAYQLQKTRNVVTEQARTDYEDALRFLKDLSAGRAVLDQPAGQDPQTAASGGSVGSRTDSEYVFNDDSLGGF